MRLLRVFPRRTKATPDDPLVRVGAPPTMFDYADEVHVSVTFTWDIPHAEWLAMQWNQVAPVKIGGPGTGQRGEAFVPGRYLKKGYVITSRGCRNRCWFCSVWKRDGVIRELPIKNGWMVQDDNLLSCSDEHILAVFEMLLKQPHRPDFSGGLEAALLKPHHAEALFKLKPNQIFFAYDSPDEYDPLFEAGRLLHGAGFSIKSHVLRCYVLCGYPSDSLSSAEDRMKAVMSAGFTPMAMLYRDAKGLRDPAWMKFQRMWARPALIYGNIKKGGR